MTITNPIKISVHAPSLANNKLNDSVQREVLVYLPPSYAHQLDKTYPVAYLIHGFGGTAQGWFNDEIALHQLADQLIENEKMQEMIIVVPENTTHQTCSAYLNSEIQGNWQDFICKDLVCAIEQQFRCQQGWQHRAIIGHSSGGDAVLKTLFLSPKVFKQGFAMSAPSVNSNPLPLLKAAYDEHFTALQQVHAGEMCTRDLTVWAHILLSHLQIIMPDLNNAPLYCQFPLNQQHWRQVALKTAPCLYEQHKTNLQGVNLTLDVGLKEPFIDASRNFVHQLQSDGYSVKLIEFNGGHIDHIASSLGYVLPYISKGFAQPTHD